MKYLMRLTGWEHFDAYAKAHQRKTNPTLEKYQALLKSEIEVLSRLIQTYPSFFSIDQSLFMRGKAYEELKLKEKAKCK